MSTTTHEDDLHHVALHWEKGDQPFTYETYTRSHTVHFGSGTTVPASSAPTYLGDKTRVNPEEQILGAISSCHMLTFLAIAAKKRLEVLRYDDDATAVLGKNEDGRIAVVSATLRPKVVFGDAHAVDAETLQRLHESSHRGCFIANSVRFPITIE